MDRIRNEYIRGTAQVGKFGEKTREARLRWYSPYARIRHRSAMISGCLVVVPILGSGMKLLVPFY